MTPIGRLDVRLDLEGGSRRVGELAASDGRLYFEYDSEFLLDPVWLSPFKLPPRPGLIEHLERDFGPIFGLFEDSLPDGWGLLLMDRFFEQLGRPARRLTVLERLAFLGPRAMGALTYHPPSHEPGLTSEILDLQEMARASRAVLEGSAHEVLA
ncbi:MAG: HipA N-terminal domain-containing protein, partial [Acidobacteriota bacterium]